ncbi:MAG: hypothetical protein B7Y43_01365 [Sphingomonas sp. 28-62-20]|uniref:hypothetical protein n=1 Tax=unclassified Sphingomonas TaxID=196159 RepID=UPI000A0ACA2C|nr:hypothetical protein [Sphingomonas sp.]OQW73858.1 MAG: hypothetical protein BVN33_09525 [Proteobacteria bacterium ST_bin13]OYY79120.1 MAG: hypothetical protein B7Y43_01365 [Sphingomonas sp. 28-62-20]
MIDPTLSVTLAIASLAGLAMVTFAGLAGWRGWLSLKQQELVRTHPEPMPAMQGASASARIEIADLKERIRKLEAIAAGVDL